jgi:hypothetical protein
VLICTRGTTNDKPGACTIRDLVTQRKVAEFASPPTSAAGDRLRFSPDGKALASGAQGASVLLWGLTGAKKRP